MGGLGNGVVLVYGSQQEDFGFGGHCCDGSVVIWGEGVSGK